MTQFTANEVHERERFEEWYTTHAFNYSRDPIGSRDCALQWDAWEAALQAHAPEAELAEAQNTIAAQQGTMGALKRKLALAEGELAALKARIDGSRHAFLGPNMDRITFLAEDIGPVGKYALVKVEE